MEIRLSEYIERLRTAGRGLAKAAAEDAGVKRIMHEVLVIANSLEVMERMGARHERAE